MNVKRFIILFMVLALAGATSFAQATKEQQDRRSQLEKEIAILDRQLRDNSAKSASAMSRLNLVQGKVKARLALVRESDSQIAMIDASILSTQKEIKAMQARLDTMTVYYEKLVRNSFKNRDAKVWYMYILASDNLSQGLKRYSYLKGLSKQMNIQAAKIKDSKAELEQRQSELVAMKSEAEKLRSERQGMLNSIKKEESEAKSISSRLLREKAKYQKELSEKKRQADALEREIKRAISSKTTNSKTPIDYKLAGQFSANKGKLPWPAEGSITGTFGKQYHSVFKNLQLPKNNGINLAVVPDAEVKSVFDGTVTQITILPGYHQCILIQHGNFFTLYAKMKKVTVKAGDKVKTSQVIGTVDTIAGETVFHFEIWDERTTPQNPETWLRPR